jgi:hypothetical protein
MNKGADEGRDVAGTYQVVEELQDGRKPPPLLPQPRRRGGQCFQLRLEGTAVRAQPHSPTTVAGRTKASRTPTITILIALEKFAVVFSQIVYRQLCKQVAISRYKCRAPGNTLSSKQLPQGCEVGWGYERCESA